MTDDTHNFLQAFFGTPPSPEQQARELERQRELCICRDTLDQALRMLDPHPDAPDAQPDEQTPSYSYHLNHPDRRFSPGGRLLNGHWVISCTDPEHTDAEVVGVRWFGEALILRPCHWPDMRPDRLPEASRRCLEGFGRHLDDSPFQVRTSGRWWHLIAAGGARSPWVTREGGAICYEATAAALIEQFKQETGPLRARLAKAQAEAQKVRLSGYWK